MASLAAAILILASPTPLHAQDWRNPDSPFRMAEGYPDIPATCDTAKRWIEHAPDTSDRVSFAIEGDLVAVEWDGALAYLVMCEPEGVQVLCVTYSTNGHAPGDTVLFAGGYARAGERRIMLDPCLSGPAD